MLHLLFSIIVYAVAVIIALLLTPGIEVGGVVGLWEWLIVGGVFGLLNAFIRPLIVLFTGRLLIRTLGLFLIVIIAAVVTCGQRITVVFVTVLVEQSDKIILSKILEQRIVIDHGN